MELNLYIYMYVSHTCVCVCIVFIVNEVVSFQELCQLMGAWDTMERVLELYIPVTTGNCL